MECFTPLKLLFNEIFNTIKTNPGSDARDQSNTIPHFPGWRNTVPTTTAKGTKPFIVGPSEGTCRSSSNSAYSNNTSSLPKQPLDNQTSNLLGNSTWSRNTRRSIDYPSSRLQGVLPSIPYSMYSIWTKYYFMFLIIAVHPSIVVHPSICPADGFTSLGGGHKTTL